MEVWLSYAHYILVPGAPGHNDPVALREVIEEYGDVKSINEDRAQLVTLLESDTWSDLVDIQERLERTAKDMTALVEQVTRLEGSPEVLEISEKLQTALDDVDALRMELWCVLDAFDGDGVPGLKGEK